MQTFDGILQEHEVCICMWRPTRNPGSLAFLLHDFMYTVFGGGGFFWALGVFLEKNNSNPANPFRVKGETVSRKPVWSDSALRWGSTVQKRGHECVPQPSLQG